MPPNILLFGFKVYMPKKYKKKLFYKTATKKLQGLLDRIQKWNSQYSKYYYVANAVMLGSLARKETSVSDIDICVQVKRTDQFEAEPNKIRYLFWRKETFGWAPPSDFYKECSMFETDVIRYLKSGDGRFDILYWDQLDGLSLTLDPMVNLVSNGEINYQTSELALENTLSITKRRAFEIVESGAVNIKNMHWDSYCNTLKKYPKDIRLAILIRDDCEDAFYSHIKDIIK